MAGKLVLASAGGSLRALAPSHVASLQGAEQGRCAWHFQELHLEVTKPHFCHTLPRKLPILLWVHGEGAVDSTGATKVVHLLAAILEIESSVFSAFTR